MLERVPVLLCEALEVLGDRYPISGFFGMTRECCELRGVFPFVALSMGRNIYRMGMERSIS